MNGFAEAKAEFLREFLKLANGPPSDNGRILPVSQEVALACAKLFILDPRPLADALIAATALVHGLTVVTRNIGDFAPMGVKCVNPWEARG